MRAAVVVWSELKSISQGNGGAMKRVMWHVDTTGEV